MDKKSLVVLSVILMIGLLTGVNKYGFSSVQVAYPEGYRDWTHVKSMVIKSGHPLYNAFGGIHHVYANDKALEALKNNDKVFPDGSILVFDLLTAEQKDNAITEGLRKVVGVMQKDSKKYKDTDGWGYEGFKGDTKDRVVKNPKADCHQCHVSQKETDFVFSKYRK